MPELFKLLEQNFDETYGVVNIRPIVDELVQGSTRPFDDAAAAFSKAPKRWRAPLFEAMRALVAEGHSDGQDIRVLVEATAEIAADSGSDEYFRTINAIVASAQPSDFLGDLAAAWINGADQFGRRLGLYAASILLERTAAIPDRLRAATAAFIAGGGRAQVPEEVRAYVESANRQSSRTTPLPSAQSLRTPDVDWNTVIGEMTPTTPDPSEQDGSTTSVAFSRAAGGTAQKIYVGNLPFSAREWEVRTLFAGYGEVMTVILPTDAETGRPRGFGFVEMDDHAAKKAIDALNGTDFGGRTLNVNLAREREDRRSGGGGGYGGGGGGYGGRRGR